MIRRILHSTPSNKPDIETTGIRSHVSLAYSAKTQVCVVNAPWPKPDALELGQRDISKPKKTPLTFFIDGERRSTFSSHQTNAFIGQDKDLQIKVQFTDCTEIIDLPQNMLNRLKTILHKSSYETIYPSRLIYWNMLLPNYFRHGDFDLRNTLPPTCHQFANYVVLGDSSYNDITSHFRVSSQFFRFEELRPGDIIKLYDRDRYLNWNAIHSMVYLGNGICIHQPGVGDVEFKTIEGIVEYYKHFADEVDLVTHRKSESSCLNTLYHYIDKLYRYLPGEAV